MYIEMEVRDIKTLVKYIHSNCIDDFNYIQAVYTNTPFELLRVVKESDYIELGNNLDFYQYESSAYKAPVTKEHIDCLIIYVDPMDE